MMGVKKYFFFDYDGTLAVPLTRDIPESTRKALRLLKTVILSHWPRVGCSATRLISSIAREFAMLLPTGAIPLPLMASFCGCARLI